MTRRRYDGRMPPGLVPMWKLPEGPLTCTYRACTSPAVHWLHPPYGKGSPWCGKHAKDAQAACTIGYASGTSSEMRLVSDLRRLRINGGVEGVT